MPGPRPFAVLLLLDKVRVEVCGVRRISQSPESVGLVGQVIGGDEEGGFVETLGRFGAEVRLELALGLGLG